MNQSLRKLFIQISPDEDEDEDEQNTTLSAETIQDIPILLRMNENIHMLFLSFIDIRSDEVLSIAHAAKGHKSLSTLVIEGTNLEYSTAKAIGNMLRKSPALKELNLFMCSIGAAGFTRLATGLARESSSLEELNLSGSDIGDEEAHILSKVIRTNRKLKKLHLSHNHIGNAGASALAGALKQNAALEHLDLGSNDIGSDGAAAFSDALCLNKTLAEVDFQKNSIDDDGAVCFAQMLTENMSLQNVHIGCFGKHGLEAFVTCIPQMLGVVTFKISSDLTSFTSDTGKDFVEALEQSVQLHNITLYDPTCANDQVDAIMPKVNHLLTLNRGGRMFLKTPSVPRALWSHILGASSQDADVLFFFLREKCDVLFKKTVFFEKSRVARKRRRCRHRDTLKRLSQ